MSVVETIIKTGYEIFKGSEDVPIVLEKPSPGMAFATPPFELGGGI